MPLRQHEPVVVGILRVLRIEAHLPEKNSAAMISAADMQVVGWPRGCAPSGGGVKMYGLHTVYGF